MIPKRLRVWWERNSIRWARNIILGLSDELLEAFISQIRFVQTLRRNTNFTEVSKIRPLPEPESTLKFYGICK